ncbi:MAG TPA: DUF1573 domain-containing protein [Bacteroidales bacterium]|mgnify:CR=1 FL=1|nr:DUF1573 domain-containing protein [Bacteroidales bacterium]
MKKLLYLSAIIAFIGVGNIYAQKKAVIKFDNTEHDFGQIKEEAGKVKYRYTFANKGNDTLRIVSVKPSCGCTTADWTKTAVAPKKSGFVEVEFDPAQRPGTFNKGIAVTTNDPDLQMVNLIIKGEVIPKPKALADAFPVVVGNMRMETSQFNFGNSKNTEIRTDTLNIINVWNKPMNLGFKDMPGYITAKAIPEILKPNKAGMIILTYDVAKRNEWGYVFDRITLATNDSLQPDKTINISQNISEDFSKMTPEELAKAAKIKFDNTTFDFGTAKQGDKVECAFVFRNEGENDLIIRKVKASCGCTATNPEKTTLKKGEESKINATFNTAGKSGKQYKSITIITNDPVNSTTILNIQGTVEQPAATETPQK